MVILPHHLSISKGGSPAARGYTRAREQGIHGVSSGASPGVRFLGLQGSDSEHGLGSGVHRAASGRHEKGILGLLPRPGDRRVLLSEDGPDAARVVLSGRIFGLGRFAERHLKGEMNRLRNAAEVAARRSPDRQ